VNNIVTTMNSDNMFCGCFGLFPSYIAGILNSVKQSDFYVLYKKEDYDVLATFKNVLLEKSALLS